MADNGDTKYMIRHSLFKYESNKTESEDYLKRAVQNGSVIAMYYYSTLLKNENYREADQQLSKYYFDMANSKEDAESMCKYAHFLIYIDQNESKYPHLKISYNEEINRYFKMAADKGSNEGSYEYAKILFRNKAKQEKDIKEAYRIVKNLSDKGYENAILGYAD